MKYIECINDIEQTLNFKTTNTEKAQQNKQIFLNALNVLRGEFKTDVSTKYLMSFVVGDDKQKSNRVNYMLKQIGLNERQRITNTYLESAPTTTAKEVEVLVYNKIDKTKKAEFGNIRVKSFPMTSHAPRFKVMDNGNLKNLGMIKLPCKVGVTARRLRTQTLHNIPL